VVVAQIRGRVFEVFVGIHSPTKASQRFFPFTKIFMESPVYTAVISCGQEILVFAVTERHFVVSQN
jgi:hypothetical protein